MTYAWPSNAAAIPLPGSPVIKPPKPRLTPDVINAWSRATTLPLTQLSAIVTHGFNNPCDKAITIARPGLFRISLAQASGRHKATCEFYIDFNRAALADGNIYVPPAMRGLGIGPRLLTNHANLGCALGLDNMELKIAGDLGAYVWSRAAVVPDQPSSAMLRPALSHRLYSLEDHITPEEHEELTERTRLRAPGDLQKIGAMRRPLDKKGVQTFLQSMEAQDAMFGQDAYELIVPDVTIGKFMLARQSMTALVDLKDPARVRAFTQTLAASPR